MTSPTNEHLNPRSFVLPNYTTTQRDLMLCELGTMIWNTTTHKINVCDVADTAASTSWAVVTSS